MGGLVVGGWGLDTMAGLIEATPHIRTGIKHGKMMENISFLLVIMNILIITYNHMTDLWKFTCVWTWRGLDITHCLNSPRQVKLSVGQFDFGNVFFQIIYNLYWNMLKVGKWTFWDTSNPAGLLSLECRKTLILVVWSLSRINWCCNYFPDIAVM